MGNKNQTITESKSRYYNAINCLITTFKLRNVNWQKPSLRPTVPPLSERQEPCAASLRPWRGSMHILGHSRKSADGKWWWWAMSPSRPRHWARRLGPKSSRCLSQATTTIRIWRENRGPSQEHHCSPNGRQIVDGARHQHALPWPHAARQQARLSIVNM